MINVTVIGGAGYVGGELIRLLVHHPFIDLISVQSNSQAGSHISIVHEDLFHSNLIFEAKINLNADVIYICRGHGKSKELIESGIFKSNQLVIDLSTDYRIESEINPFIYALPEWKKDVIKTNKRLANCGCFATAIQLALLPMAQSQLLENDIHIGGITGATGAGAKLLKTTHFTWRNDNVSIYKAFNHQHIKEVDQMINFLNPNFKGAINFIPMRGNFSRGILISLYTKIESTLNTIKDIYKEYYTNSAFVRITESEINLKQVVNTNYCLLKIEKHGENIMITSIIDNLLKGAAGSAIQNMNIHFDRSETEGLMLKANFH